MRQQSRPARRIVSLGRWFLVFILMVFFLNVVPVQAEGGIGMSGSFYQQEFIVPQGSSVSGPDIYVVVFNNSSDQIKVKMTNQTPPGVRLVMSQSEFTLPAGGQMQVLIGVEVGTDAVPGKYEVSVSAEPYKETATGIQLIGAASQKANLTVLGEFGTVRVKAMSPDRQPVTATIRLYRIVNGKEREVAYSENGMLDARVAPGNFIVVSFMGGIKIAEQEFNIAAGDNKEITLSGATIYFENFDIVPNFQKKDGKLAFAQIVYTIKNLYQRVDKGEVLLRVSLNTGPLAELTLATLSPLENGRVGLNYNFIPSGGWVDGEYDFKLQLNIDGKPYASSQVKRLTVSDGALVEGTIPTGNPGVNAGSTTFPLSPFIIVGTIVAVIIIIIIGIVFLARRKTRRV